MDRGAWRATVHGVTKGQTLVNGCVCVRACLCVYVLLDVGKN